MPTARIRVIIDISPGGQIEDRSVSFAFDEAAFIGTYEVATAVTDQAFPLSTTTGIATIQAFYIFSTQTITIRQVAGDTGEQVTANSPYLVSGTSRTALLVSNASGSTANITLWAAGT